MHLFLGLKRLVYPGYDSAGLGVDDTSGQPILIILTNTQVVSISRFEATRVPWLRLSWSGCGRYPGQQNPSYQNTWQGGAPSGDPSLIKVFRIPFRILIRISDA
jgi:hypothetical protein